MDAVTTRGAMPSVCGWQLWPWWTHFASVQAAEQRVTMQEVTGSLASFCGQVPIFCDSSFTACGQLNQHSWAASILWTISWCPGVSRYCTQELIQDLIRQLVVGVLGALYRLSQCPVLHWGFLLVWGNKLSFWGRKTKGCIPTPP